MQNKVVVHFLDGRLVKGFTSDFFPNKPAFHVEPAEEGTSTEVQVDTLKGVFFVKSFTGNSLEKHRRDVERTGLGRKIRVDFKDGETLIGYTSGYSPTRTAFFVFPADPQNNNEKVFVVTAATDKVTFV
jgi:hypothetical protein